MESSISVTVAVPCYNGEDSISDVLEALRAQTKKPDEIIVVDDASQDSSADIIKSYPEVKLIRHLENRGLATSRNTALGSASGNILIYIDADAVPHPSLIESIIREYKGNDIAGVGGRGIESEDSNIYDKWRKLHLSQTYGDNYRDNVALLWGLCSSYRKKTLEKLGGFDPVYKTNGDDVDIGIRINKLGLRLVYTSEAIVYHNRKDSLYTLKDMVCRWYFWGFIAKRKNGEMPLRSYLKIIIKNLILNSCHDLFVEKNIRLSLINLLAFFMEIKAVIHASFYKIGEKS